MIDIGDKEFQEKVVKRSLRVPVVVDFWASWCMPCRILGPVLEKLEKDYGKRFDLVKVSVEENKEAAKKYNITNIPAVKMFKSGKMVAEFSGAIPEVVVKEWLDRNL